MGHSLVGSNSTEPSVMWRPKLPSAGNGSVVRRQEAKSGMSTQYRRRQLRTFVMNYRPSNRLGCSTANRRNGLVSQRREEVSHARLVVMAPMGQMA